MHSSYDEIYINDTDQSGIMFAGLENGDVHVNNMKVVNAMDTLLKKRGYSIIDKDNNTILFQRSTRGADFGSGIAYSMDSKKPNIDYLTLLEPLEKSNWYYYEADFAKWKKINGNQ